MSAPNDKQEASQTGDSGRRVGTELEPSRELSDLLPDYLNGHLSGAQLQRVETALQTNASLRDQLQFESRLQTAMRAEASAADEQVASSRGTGFDAIADRIVDSPADRVRAWWTDLWTGGGLRAGVPAFAFLLFAFVAASSTLLDSDSPLDGPINEFETRTSVVVYEQPTLRLLPRMDVQSDAFAALLDEYDLKLSKVLVDSNMAEVTLGSTTQSLDGIAEQLSADPRVLLAKALGLRPVDPDGASDGDSARRQLDR